MTQIDWSTSPDWAIGHGLIVSGSINQVWFGEKSYMIVGDSRPYVYGGGTGETRHNHMRNSIQFQQVKPEPWTGEGPPPVGTVCEFHGAGAGCHDDPWHPDLKDGDHVTIIAYFNDSVGQVAAFTFKARNENIATIQVEQARPGAFRPLRTPAQLAAEEREKAIEDMCNTSFDKVTPRSAGLLYDAGYRKVEVKP